MAEVHGALREVVPVLAGEAAVARLPEVRGAIESERRAAMAPLLPETGDVAESGHEVAGAELEHEAAVAKAMGVPRLELPMLSNEAAVVELEAVMRSMEFSASVRREMAKDAAAIARLGGLRRHRCRGQHRSEDHDFAHLPRSLIERHVTLQLSSARITAQRGRSFIVRPGSLLPRP